jgi:hypothetical protein
MCRYMRITVGIISLVLAGCQAMFDGGETGGEPPGGNNNNGDSNDEDPGAGANNEERCRHVDVVFSVDNSGSMTEEKTAMRDIAFPGFAQELGKISGGIDDFRVGVLDACYTPANFHTRGVAGPCNFQGGKTWMESTSTALTAEFKCVGDIDSSTSMCTGDNDDEQPASTATIALGPMMQATGAPNAGFLRDDALLVVVAITDEDEQPAPTDASPQQIYDRLVAVKGDVTRMVFLGIGGASSCDGAYGSANAATKLKATTDLFVAKGRGLFWDLCAGTLEQGFAQALELIESACDQFDPVY